MSAWQDLVTASLIGTERAMVPRTGIPGLPPPGDPAAGRPDPAAAPLLDRTGQQDPAAALLDRAGQQDPAAAPLLDRTGQQDPAAALLDRAGLLTAARRAGRMPDRAEPLPAAEPDTRPAVSQSAGLRLSRMLGGEYPDLLTEWLTAASGRGLRVPPQFLPALLDRARRGRAADPDSSRLGRLVAEAGGPRARWLAGLNPDWNFVAQVAGEDAWRFGDAAQRRGYLSALRARDPGAARELIAASWDAAGAARAVFVSVLADGLSLADEPLLEAALDDRADDVRGWAAFLLASLPGSALGQRMAERAGRCLRMKRDARGRRLLVSPPAECDATMRRDGIMPGGAPPQEQARSLLEVVARAPLDTWTEAFGLDPAQIVAVRSGDWAPLLFTAWARAAVAQRRQDWVAALIGQALSGRPPDKPAEGAALRQLARRADPALGAPGSLPAPEPNAPAAVHDAIRVLRFRHEMLKELDDDHRDG